MVKAGSTVKIKTSSESVFSVSYSEGRAQEQGCRWRERELEKDLSRLSKSLRLLSCLFEFSAGLLGVSESAFNHSASYGQNRHHPYWTRQTVLPF